MTPEIINALTVILQNQVRLADMVANAYHRTQSELQDDANRIGVAAYDARTVLERASPRQGAGQ